MRPARHKSKSAACYHLLNHAAGDSDYLPFEDPIVAAKFEAFFDFYLELYFCERSGHCLMGNHYHAIVHFEEYRELDRKELVRRAKWRFGRRFKSETRHWKDSDWEIFNRSLFDVSKFMQHVQGQFATWFNRRTGRTGHFWGDRYKNPEYLDPEAVRQVIFYIELNPVRVGLVQRPEQWKNSSANWRFTGRKSDHLIPLQDLFPPEMGEDSFTLYRARLYYYGAQANDEGKQVIPDWIVRREERRGFARPGMFRQRLPFFSKGVVIGSRDRIALVLDQYRKKGLYKRRRNPIPQLGGILFSLRATRPCSLAPG